MVQDSTRKWSGKLTYKKGDHEVAYDVFSPEEVGQKVRSLKWRAGWLPQTGKQYWHEIDILHSGLKNYEIDT